MGWVGLRLISTARGSRVVSGSERRTKKEKRKRKEKKIDMEDDGKKQMISDTYDRISSDMI